MTIKRYCLTQCSMPMLNLLLGAGMQAGLEYQEAVGRSDILIVGDMAGDSVKLRRARALGVKIVYAKDVIAMGVAL